MKITFLDTSMEKFESHGEGTWEVLGEQLKVMLSYLEKDKKMKVEPLFVTFNNSGGPRSYPWELKVAKQGEKTFPFHLLYSLFD